MATLYNIADSNSRKTFFLITIFLIFVILLGWLFSYALDSTIILYIAVVFSIATSVSSYWFSDKIVLKATKAQPIKKEDDPELYRIVENISITAGIPMPKVFILNESQPNAFATGRDEKHAVVAVTKGLLGKLERSEIEGVIAHEISHIKNKDMLLQTVVVVLVGVIAILSDFFLRITFWSKSDSNNNNNAVMIVIALIAAILAPIAASLIQLSISRKREFLADASGALLTRYPEGLASALEKISADDAPLRTANNSNSHLFISSPLRGEMKKSWISKLFLTHPPIEERVANLRGMKI
ncbi:MAG: M48 family metallopeptidase [Candidatus Pacebacteria bacterium]|nr:M48 family metallopeptidase [Candidatus Paceibacterota bacterium]MDD2757477.1 M48 family metallopeptidase [Candidatus Paceibacterota bacterium]MDD3970085.1 M48 family metallopeptidase [Candidatus Paceibacterota bacterium]